MNQALITGMIIVTGALIFYSIAVWSEQRNKISTPLSMTTLAIRVLLGTTATGFMIAGSRNIPFTLHAMIGYSALAAM